MWSMVNMTRRQIFTGIVIHRPFSSALADTLGSIKPKVKRAKNPKYDLPTVAPHLQFMETQNEIEIRRIMHRYTRDMQVNKIQTWHWRTRLDRSYAEKDIPSMKELIINMHALQMPLHSPIKFTKVLLDADELELAIKIMNRLDLEKKKALVDIRHQLAWYYCHKNQIQDAIAMLPYLGNRSQSILRKLAEMYAEMEQWDKALEYYSTMYDNKNSGSILFTAFDWSRTIAAIEANPNEKGDVWCERVLKNTAKLDETLIPSYLNLLLCRGRVHNAMDYILKKKVPIHEMNYVTLLKGIVEHDEAFLYVITHMEKRCKTWSIKGLGYLIRYCKLKRNVVLLRELLSNHHDIALDDQSYDDIMWTYASSGHYQSVHWMVTLYDDMVRRDVKMTVFVLHALIRGHPDTTPMEELMNIVNEFKFKHKIMPNHHVYTSLLMAAAHWGDNESVSDLLYKMKEENIQMDIVTYAALSLHMARRGDLTPESSASLLKEMKVKDVKISEKFYHEMLSTITDGGFTGDGYKLIRLMKESNVKLDHSFYCALMRTLITHRQLHDAFSLYEEILCVADIENLPAELLNLALQSISTKEQLQYACEMINKTASYERKDLILIGQETIDQLLNQLMDPELSSNSRTGYLAMLENVYEECSPKQSSFRPLSL